ncbi:unnamed protein product, partial [Laminaria digitata]
MGIRAGAWEPLLFMALPIVLSFFSFLFAFCALIGLVTRSTIAALLLTLLFWCTVFIVNVGDSVMIAQREGSIFRLEDRQKLIPAQERFAEARIVQMREDGKPIPGEDGEPLPEGMADTLEAVNPTLRTTKNRVAEAEAAVDTWTAWAKRVHLLKTVLPKTQETIGLLERHLITLEELDQLMNPSGDAVEAPDEDVPAMADPRVANRVNEVIRSRSVGW